MSAMSDYGLDIDLNTVFLNSEEEEKIFKRLSTYFHDSRIKIISLIDEDFNNHRDRANKTKENAEKIAQLISENKEIEDVLEHVLLQQKILDKKITKSVSCEDELKEIIENQKSQRETLALEMVDLQQELEKQKEEKRKEWDAIKYAMSMYKKRLHVHIDFDQFDDHDSVTVFFFADVNSSRDNYYVVLLNFNDSWKVSNIQPSLEGKYLNDLELDLSRNDYERPQITKFLCGIRDTFMKYYLND